MANLQYSRNQRAPSLDETRLAVAMQDVFRRCDVMHGSLSYERADGHYMHGVKSDGVPSNIYSLGLHLTEQNRHPGLLLANNRHTPIAISIHDPEIAENDNVREFANALDEEGFDKVYYLPIRDLNGRLFVSGISSRKRKIDNLELRLIYSYCLDAIEKIMTETESDLSDKPILTPRERECLILAAKGHTEKQTAKSLSISPYTVHTHLENSKHKFGARNKLSAILKGLSLHEIIPAEIQ